jgi:hypothetical protein
MKTITTRLASMKKPQRFIVYPFKPENNGHITVQSDKAIGRFDPITGKGLLNYKGSKPKYFMHLSPFTGAIEYQFPPDFVNECIASQPVSEDSIGGGVYVS